MVLTTVGEMLLGSTAFGIGLITLAALGAVAIAGNLDAGGEHESATPDAAAS